MQIWTPSPSEFDDFLDYIKWEKNALVSIGFFQQILKPREDKDNMLSLHIVAQTQRDWS